MSSDSRSEPSDLFWLRQLAVAYPTVNHAVARIAHIEAQRRLPKAAIHMLSDVHGEYVKLRHVINNASGKLRPVVRRVFGDDLTEAEQRRLLNLLYYPHETWQHMVLSLSKASRAELAKQTIRRQVRVLRYVARHYPVVQVTASFPEAFRDIMLELLIEPALQRSQAYVDAMLDALIARGKGATFVRRLSRVIRNLTVDELIVAGDVGDRGPRIDKVVSYLMKQPKVHVVWGNHDVLWMGACLGQTALIATVVRISLRYGRLKQLEEGYGIPLTPVYKLIESVYGDDPAERFMPRAESDQTPLLVARMQKAMAIIQFKLDGQLIAEYPDWEMSDRALLHRIDLAAGTVTLADGQTVELVDRHFPTLDPDDPYRLSDEEATCLASLTEAFVSSTTLWDQMSFLFKSGTMHCVRDGHLVFHAAYPVDEDGEPLSMVVDGERLAGRALFEGLQRRLQTAWRRTSQEAVDTLWYLWCGPASPLFGKDRMATFESYFIADPSYKKERKNPYFDFLNDATFCERVLAEFGVTESHGIIVNGHMPVRVEKGDSPVKAGGRAVVIDGAFAQAYGDRGYTLVLGSRSTYLAEHHPFVSVDDAIATGADIIPDVSDLICFEGPRTVEDTELGGDLIREIEALEALIVAYRENTIREQL